MQHHATLVRTNNADSYLATVPPGAIVVTHDKLGIDEARTLTHDAQLRPADGEASRFVIVTGFITHEAQNALLKLLEEPPADTFFALVLPPAFQLLPTLQSRIGQTQIEEDDVVDDVWQQFVAASYADRLKQIDVWQKSKDKDPQWLQSMVAGVQTVQISTLAAQDAAALQLVGAKLATRGASNKMLLEHLALLLPLQK